MEQETGADKDSLHIPVNTRNINSIRSNWRPRLEGSLELPAPLEDLLHTPGIQGCKGHQPVASIVKTKMSPRRAVAWELSI